MKKTSAVVVAIISVLYLLNIGAGIVDLIPDIIPGIGNIDEGVAGAALLWAISVLRDKPMKQVKSE